MPTELEELVEFLHHANPQIRSIALENLTGYSTSQPSIFKADDLRPIKDLKGLVRDQPNVAKDALTILINLSDDREVLEELMREDDAGDGGGDAFLHTLLTLITREDESNADLISMLLANLAKSDFITRLLAVQLAPRSSLSTSRNAMDQLMDCFVRGAEGAYNTKADFDYLAYLFADMAKFADGRRYFTTEQAYDAVVPVTKVIVFTEHRSVVRRKGVASTVKNITFDVPSHALLTGPRVNLLPYVLLPLTGGEEYDEDEMLSMPADLQLLPESKRRDPDASILVTHLETLLLLTATRPMRELLREIGVYPIVRETHLHVEDEDVREACDRLVQVLKRDEPEIDEADEIKGDGRRKGAPRVEEVDEEETIVEIF